MFQQKNSGNLKPEKFIQQYLTRRVWTKAHFEALKFLCVALYLKTFIFIIFSNWRGGLWALTFFIPSFSPSRCSSHVSCVKTFKPLKSIHQNLTKKYSKISKKLPKHCVSSLFGWPSLPPLELVDIFLFCQRLNVLPMIYLNSTSDITSSVQSASAHIAAVPIGYPPRTCP